jgi:tryptophan-rich sensory protein
VNTDTFWATVAQVVPVLFLVLAMELGLAGRLHWKRAPTTLRLISVFLMFALVYVETRAFMILGGGREYFNDESITVSLIASALGLVAGLAGAYIWLRREK